MRISNAIFILIILTVISAIVWIRVTEIEEIIRAEGQVEPKEQIQIVQPRFTGKLEKILVNIGDQVQKGQIVAQINKLEAEAQFRENSSTLDVLNAEITRLKAEVSGSELIDWSAELPENLKEVQNALFIVRRDKVLQELEILKQQTSSSQNEMVELKQRIEGLEKLLSLKNEEKNILEPLVLNGIEPKTRLLQISQEIQRFENEIILSKTNLQAVKIELQKIAAQAVDVMKRFKAESFEELARKQNQLRLTKTKTDALLDRLTDTDLKAPISGVITKIHPKGVGEIVTGGKELIEIAPFFKNVRVKAKLKPQDITNLMEGQQTKILLTSYDFTVYGSISGYVEEIAQNTSETDRGEIYYETWIQSKNLKLSKSDIKPEILPGMLAQVEIIGKKRSIYEYLMKPVLETTARAFTEK